jgi:hypothetical protein
MTNQRKDRMSGLINMVEQYVLGIWKKEPTRVVAVVVAAVVFAAAKAGIVVSAVSVEHAVAYIIPILVGGELTRAHVTPAVNVPAVKVP